MVPKDDPFDSPTDSFDGVGDTVPIINPDESPVKDRYGRIRGKTGKPQPNVGKDHYQYDNPIMLTAFDPENFESGDSEGEIIIGEVVQAGDSTSADVPTVGSPNDGGASDGEDRSGSKENPGQGNPITTGDQEPVQATEGIPKEDGNVPYSSWLVVNSNDYEHARSIGSSGSGMVSASSVDISSGRGIVNHTVGGKSLFNVDQSTLFVTWEQASFLKDVAANWGATPNHSLTLPEIQEILRYEDDISNINQARDEGKGYFPGMEQSFWNYESDQVTDSDGNPVSNLTESLSNGYIAGTTPEQNQQLSEDERPTPSEYFNDGGGSDSGDDGGPSDWLDDITENPLGVEDGGWE